jgi:hypothetical protein
MNQQSKAASSAVTPIAPKAPGLSRRSQGRASFPNRVTLDLDDARYEWLTETADNSGAVGAANLLRAALDHLISHPEALRTVVSRAQELRREQRAANRRR